MVHLRSSPWRILEIHALHTTTYTDDPITYLGRTAWDCDKYPAMTERQAAAPIAKQTFGGKNGKVNGGQGEV